MPRKLSRTTFGIRGLSDRAMLQSSTKGSTSRAPAEHEGVGDMNQRRQIDVGYTAGDQFDKNRW